MNTHDAERLKAVLDLTSGWPELDALSVLTAAVAHIIRQATNGDIRKTDRLIAKLVAELRVAPGRRNRDRSGTRLH